MTSELENIILTIDTREQNQKRIKAVEDWAQGHGAIVEHSALKLCDYALIGEFRGVSVNIGIEYKAWDNFLSDVIEDMEDKLVRSQELYDTVALFIETGNYMFKPDVNGCHAILGYSDMAKAAMRKNGNPDPTGKTLAGMEGLIQTLSANDIHVRQLRSDAQFPYSLYNLLVYLTTQHKLKVKNLTYEHWLLNMYMSIPEIGLVRAKNLIKRYPNPFWLCSASEESLIQVLGRTTGQVAYQHLRSREFETDEWRNNFCKDGTEKDEPEKLICSACGEDKCTCVPYFDKPKLLKENEGAQAFDARPKTPKKCDYTDPKKREECKTPDHFKQLSQHSSHPLACSNIPIQSDAQVVKGDNSSHPGTILNTIIPKPDDPPIPPKNGAVKQGVFATFPPAETHEDKELSIGLDDEPLKCVVKCRVCHQIIEPSNDNDTGFCLDPECIEARKKPVHAKNLIDSLKSYLKEPHTVIEIVKEFGCTSGYAFGSCMGGVKAGWLKKVTEQNGKTTFQRIKP